MTLLFVQLEMQKGMPGEVAFVSRNWGTKTTTWILNSKIQHAGGAKQSYISIPTVCVPCSLEELSYSNMQNPKGVW